LQGRARFADLELSWTNPAALPPSFFDHPEDVEEMEYAPPLGDVEVSEFPRFDLSEAESGAEGEAANDENYEYEYEYEYDYDYEYEYEYEEVYEDVKKEDIKKDTGHDESSRSAHSGLENERTNGQ